MAPRVLFEKKRDNVADGSHTGLPHICDATAIRAKSGMKKQAGGGSQSGGGSAADNTNVFYHNPMLMKGAIEAGG